MMEGIREIYSWILKDKVIRKRGVVSRMKQQLESIQKQAMEKLAQVSELRVLEDLKVAYLGKKGELTQILKGMGA